MLLKRSSCWILLIVTLTPIFLATSVEELKVEESEIDQDLPIDPCNKLKRLKVAPGDGWDNLKNQVGLSVFDKNYEKCNNLDGKMEVILPERVNIVHYHPSREEYRSQLFTDWTLYSGIGTNTINEDGDLEFGFPGVSGSFSSDYYKIKQKRIDDKEVTARYQLRYTSHTIRLTSRTKLDDIFTTNVKKLLKLAQDQETKKLQHEAELLVKSYGTHYIDNVDIGLVVIQEDYISAAVFLLKDSDVQQKSLPIFANGTMSFFNDLNLLPIPPSYSYLRKSSSLKVIGTLSAINDVDWIVKRRPDVIIREPEILRVSGRALDKIITMQNFPDQTLNVVLKVKDAVRTAIEMYYKTNAYLGCTLLGSANFNQWANQDDNSCTEKIHQYLFGGVYQVCTPLNKTDEDVCENKNINNLATGDQSCPNGFKPKLLYDGLVVKPVQETSCYKICSGFLIFKKCHLECNEHVANYVGSYAVYWCDGGPNNSSDKVSTVLFGGAFGGNSVNPVTGLPICPDTYNENPFQDDFTICISNDTASGREHSMDLSGFSTCIDSFTFQCPPGYFERTIAIRDNCVISYCTKRRNVIPKNGTTNFPVLISPPFTVIDNVDVKHIDVKPSSVTKTEQEFDDQLVPTDLVVGVIIAVLLLVLIVVIIVATCIRRSDSATLSPYTDIDKQP